jgi:hypothetical protein
MWRRGTFCFSEALGRNDGWDEANKDVPIFLPAERAASSNRLLDIEYKSALNHEGWELVGFEAAVLKLGWIYAFVKLGDEDRKAILDAICVILKSEKDFIRERIVAHVFRTTGLSRANLR